MNALNLAAIIEHCKAQQNIQATPRQWQVLHHITDCRTAAMGGQHYACPSCQHHWTWYHSCRDRHCPQCQGHASQQWCEQQKSQLLPVPYFHLVFTLPHELNTWMGKHGRCLYRLLFQSCWNSLKTLAERKLKGQLGMTAVLHTWGQQLTRHVHLHCLVPAGSLKYQARWQTHNKNYLLPVKALSNRFRGQMVSRIREAWQQGLLATVSKSEITPLLNRLMQKPWVVYSKSALNYRETLVNYLARYTHRIGLSNGRILVWDQHRVTLKYLDYKDSGRKQLTLTPEELVRRFLLHVLPKGFMRVRHYGYLANAIKAKRLACIRKQIKPNRTTQEKTREKADRTSLPCCPNCQSPVVKPPVPAKADAPPEESVLNTS
jgi:hypothetical protein